MSPATYNLVVEIVRFVDECFPGWVECKFVDAEGHEQTFVDKVSIFSSEMLDATSAYPRMGSVACIVLSRWQDAGGREVARISTKTPFLIESTDGLSEFVVLSQQLSEDH